MPVCSINKSINKINKKRFCLQPARCANQIEDICKEVEKTINQTIQNTLNTLEKDCEKIADLVDKKLTADT